MGGRHRQARLGAVHRRAIDRLAEAEVRAGPGVRDRWGHRPEGLADRPGSHPGRLPRGRRARVRGEGGDRLQPGAAPGASEEAGSPGAGHTAVHARDRAPAGQGRSLGPAGPGGAGRVRRVDPRRPAPPSAVPGTADGQGSPRGRPGASPGGAVSEEQRVRVGRRSITITRPDKVLFPDDGITKADLVDHYVRVADVMLPHVRDRPVSMKRYPEGIEGQVFYQKRVPDWFPDWIPHVEVRTSKGPHVYAVIADAATLAFLANQACIEPHTWLSRADRPDHPDLVVFDLDPSADDLPMLRRGARAMRRLLDEAGLVPFVKTSGSKGYHVVAPLDRSADHETVRVFAEGVAEVAVDRHPDVFTTEFRKAKRGDLVFLDVMRNGYGATVIPPYAVRAFPGAPVAAPIEWDELGRVEPRTFTMTTLPRRLARRGDPWAGIRRRARALADPDRRLARLGAQRRRRDAPPPSTSLPSGRAVPEDRHDRFHRRGGVHRARRGPRPRGPPPGDDHVLRADACRPRATRWQRGEVHRRRHRGRVRDPRGP